MLFCFEMFSESLSNQIKFVSWAFFSRLSYWKVHTVDSTGPVAQLPLRVRQRILLSHAIFVKWKSVLCMAHKHPEWLIFTQSRTFVLWCLTSFIISAHAILLNFLPLNCKLGLLREMTCSPHCIPPMNRPSCSALLRDGLNEAAWSTNKQLRECGKITGCGSQFC